MTRPRSSVTTGNALSSAPAGTPEVPGDGVDRRHPGRLHRRRLGPARRQLHGLGLRARDLDVGGVAGRERDVVLARRAGRHVLVRAEPAHHPDVGLDPVPLEADPVEHAVVGADELVVGGGQAVGVAVERVRVLHDELARAQDPRARARLVALLGLEVVEEQRQVAVGAHDLGDVERERLLVRQRQDHRRPAAVLELEDLVDRVAAGRRHSSRGVITGASISWEPMPSISSRTIWTTFWCTRQPAGSHVHRPEPSCRTRPARTISLCEIASASAGG